LWHGRRVDEIKCQHALFGVLSGGVSQCRRHLSEVVAMRKDAYREVELDALAVVFVGCRVDA